MAIEQSLRLRRLQPTNAAFRPRRTRRRRRRQRRPASASRLDQGHHDPGFAQDVIEESRKPAGAGRFLGAVVRPVQAAEPDHREGGARPPGAVQLVKMNIDDHPAIAGQLGIQSIPAVIAFDNGQPVDGFIGALPESQVKAFIERVAGRAGAGGAEALVAEAEARFTAGDTAGAAEHLAASSPSRAGQSSTAHRRACRLLS